MLSLHRAPDIVSYDTKLKNLNHYLNLFTDEKHKVPCGGTLKNPRTSGSSILKLQIYWSSLVILHIYELSKHVGVEVLHTSVSNRTVASTIWQISSEFHVLATYFTSLIHDTYFTSEITGNHEERENIIGYIVRGKCSITYCYRTIYLSANSTFIKETQETQKNKLHTSKLKKQKISPAAWQNPVTLFFFWRFWVITIF